jgi:hypothetical protein
VTTRIAGELPAAEVEHTLNAVHFWARDTRNHRYRRDQLTDPARDLLEPQCSQARYTIPARYAFRDELSQELGEDRDRSRDCPACFRRSR